MRPNEKALELNAQLQALKLDALDTLQQAVDTGELRQAWTTFTTLRELLPFRYWVIDEEKYPLMKKKLNDGWFERYAHIDFSSMMDGDTYYILNPDVEVPDWMEPFDREVVEAQMWEIINNRNSGFCYDW